MYSPPPTPKKNHELKNPLEYLFLMNEVQVDNDRF